MWAQESGSAGTVESARAVANPFDGAQPASSAPATVTVSLSATPNSVFENGGGASIHASISQAKSSTITVTVSTSSSHVTQSGTTLTIPVGATRSSGTVVLTAVNNDLTDGDRDVEVTGTATGVADLVVAPVDLEVVDDEGTGKLAFRLSSSSIYESREALRGGVNKTSVIVESSRPVAADVSVTVTVAPYSNNAKTSDFTVSGSVLTIPTGSTTSTGEVTITAVDNAVENSTKTISVSGAVDATSSFDAPALRRVSILNDDPPAFLRIRAIPDAISENGGVTKVTMTADAPVPEDISLTLAVTWGDTSNITMDTDRTLRISKGETTSTDSVTITAVDNNTLGYGKTLRLGRETNRLWGSFVSQDFIRIYDDDWPRQLLISAESHRLIESDGPTRIFATLSDAPTDSVEIEIGFSDLTTADSTAFEFSTNRVLVIPPGATTSTGEAVTLSPIDNDYANPKFNYQVYLGATVTKGQSQVSQITSVSNLTMGDDEPWPTVTLKSDNRISENGGVTTVTAEMDVPLKGETTTVTVAADPVLPTTTAADFTQTGKTLTIAPGATTSTGTVTIAAVDNSIHAPHKTVSVSGAVAVTTTSTTWYVGRIRLPGYQHLRIIEDDLRQAPHGNPTRPKAPVGLEATADRRHAIVLSWTPPSDNGGFEVTGYRIEVSADAGKTWSDLVANTGDATEYTHAVAPGTTRHYRVRAINSLGESGPSNVATATTPETLEPGAPHNLEAFANGQRAIQLSWSPPSDDGGAAVTGYRIEVSDDAGETWSDLVAKTEAGTTTHRHTGLSSATTRHYRVRAINSAGESEPSNVATATTAEIDMPPSPPRDLVATADGHHAIVLSWTTPLDEGGAPIGGYHIEVSDDGGETWRELVADTWSISTTYRDAGIAAGTTRHYRVSAINIIGLGQPSNVASATTDAAVSPSAPQNLTADAGTAEVALAWRPPTESGGADIERYEYRADGVGDWVGVGLATSATVTSLEPGRTYLFEVRAVNHVGPGPPASISVTLNSHPAFTHASYLFELAENVDGSASPVELGAVLAEDPDGDRVSYEMATADTSLFRVRPTDGGVAYVGPGEDYEAEPNRYDFAVRADDGRGGLDTAAVTVIVTPVNEPPEATDDDAETDEDTPVRIHPLDNDVDPDGDTLRVESVSEAAHGTVEIVDGKVVVYRPDENWHGEDRFTYVASDGELTDEATVSVTVLPVNDAPAAEGTIPHQLLEEGGEAVELDLTDYFSDIDGDALALAASSADPTVAAASVSGGILTLTPVAHGATTIDVDATDPGGLSARQTFAVEVSDRMVKSVLTDVFAAMGRGVLASMRATLSRRGEAAPAAGESRLSVFGRTLPLGAGAGWRATAADALTDWIGDACRGLPGGRDALGTSARLFSGRGLDGLGSDGMGPPGVGAPGCSLEALGGSGGLGGPAGWGASDLQLVLAGGGPERAGGGGATWTLWTQGDIQNFSGSGTVAGGYDGDLRSAYAGIDVQGPHWLAGLAYARSVGAADWDVGKAAGRVSTRLNTVHPYLRWSNGATSVWAMLGVGRGTADHDRTHAAAAETSDLGLTAGIVEVRHDLRAGRAGPQVGLRGDAGWARLSTDGGRGTIDGLDAAVRQARLGLELGWEIGTATSGIAPFGQVHVRRDDGDGLDGRGVEVLGGLKARLGPVEIDAQGRSLAVHSVAGYRESGASVALRVGGNPGQPGLSLHVAPRWGAPAGPMSVLWQDHTPVVAQSGAFSARDGLPGQPGGAPSEPSGAPSGRGGMDTSVGYGVPLGEDRILTPFARFAGSEHGRRLQFGVRLGSVELVSDLTPGMPSSQGQPFTLAGRLTFGTGPPTATHPTNAR